jgi:hypothetical protein
LQYLINNSLLNNQLRLLSAGCTSPSIVERLALQGGFLTPKIDDWRAMVDWVMIHPPYEMVDMLGEEVLGTETV